MPIYDQALQSFEGFAKRQWEQWLADEQVKERICREFFQPVIEFVAALNEQVVEFSQGSASIRTANLLRSPGTENGSIEIEARSTEGSKSITLGKEGNAISHRGNHWSLTDLGFYAQLINEFRPYLTPPSPGRQRSPGYRPGI